MRSFTARAVTALTVVLLLGSLAATQLGARLVVTDGDSMRPGTASGDLVVTLPATSYAIGDVVAYHSDLLDTTVLHRIVSGDRRGWTFQGDNNSWLDPEQRTDEQLMGRQVIHVPRLGRLVTWTSNARLWLLGAAFVIAAAFTTRTVRKAGPMAQHRKPHRRLVVPHLPAAGATGASLAGLAALALVAGVAAWAAPQAAASSSASTEAVAQSATFAYSAALRPSPASGDGTAEAPEPVFTALADQVSVAIEYKGPAQPTTVTVAGRLSAAGGWTDRLELADPVVTSTGRHDSTVMLRLDELRTRAQRAADAIGIPVGEIGILVEPTFTLRGADRASTPLRAKLELVLDPTALRMKDPAASLTSTADATAAGSSSADGTPRRAGLAWTADRRSQGLAVLAAAALAAAAYAGYDRHRRRHLSAVERQRRRHRKALVPAEPAALDTHTVVHVHDLDKLVALACSWQLPVLHWSLSDADVFTVLADTTAYRHVSGGATAASAPTG